MTNPKNVLLRLAHFRRAKSFRTSAALILAMLMFLVTIETTVATAQIFTDVFNFDGSHGAFPDYPQLLAQGRDGNLYGTTPRGGTNMQGVVLKITPRGKPTTLFNFDKIQGSRSFSGLTLGTNGNFYGATYGGGGNGTNGTIFKITKSGSLTTLYIFTGGTDGGNPIAPPIQGADGNLYGTTSLGTAYKITLAGAFTSLGAIPGGSAAPLLQGTDGGFYGTTVDGGSFGNGTVFKITPKGKMKILHSFKGTHGQYPYAPLIQGGDGNLYGTTYGGGAFHRGVAFKLTPHGAITVLHDFNVNDGFAPLAGLIQATDGNFYGATSTGGNGDGTIFEITPDGAYTMLHNFEGHHGAASESTPMQHTNGKIYGLARIGGAHGKGVIYSVDVGIAPFVRTLPTSSKVGKTMGILGGGLTGTSAVSFNGTPATFTVISDTYLKGTVPSGATTGFVTVTTPGGTLKSNQEFRVKP